MSDRLPLQVRSKVWLEIDGEPLLGSGREELLRLVRECGSINAAAAGMGIGYRKAWTSIDAMEKRLGFPLVTRQRGGRGGGESALTSEAVDLLERYDRLTEGVREEVDRKFAEIF
jgi:molybdate transport system regulatory protein